MSNFNDRIRQVQVKNFTTTPQNLPEFQNPYLLVSKNKAYNKLATKQVLKKQKTNQNLNNPQIQNQNPNKITDDDAEDLARHVMSEVYRNRSDRREINGFIKTIMKTLEQKDIIRKVILYQHFYQLIHKFH